MKIGVFGDTHVGRRIPRTIAELRRKAYRSAFTKAIDALIEERVEYVIHAGDLFERRSMTPGDAVFVKEEFQRMIDELGDTSIILVRGNHDGTLENNVLDYVRHPLARYLKVLGDKTLLGEEEAYSDGTLTAVGLGYHPYIRAKFESSREALEKSLNDGGFKILILHNFVEGYHSIPPGTPEHSKLSLRTLSQLPADLIVAGHYHENLPLTRTVGSHIVTPGGTEAIDLSDQGPFGIHIVEVEEGIEDRFVEIEPLHRIRNIQIDSRGAVNPLSWYRQRFHQEAAEYASELAGESAEGILRVVLKGKTDEDPIDLTLMIDGDVEDLRASQSQIIHIEIVNRVEEARERFHPPAEESPRRYLEEVFQPLGPFIGEALHLSEEVQTALETGASPQTNLLTPSDRKVFVDRWMEILERVGG
ncbi:MAG: exonuclease SbcCD subunit D [Candidatus Geothermarchaeales archaeon]